jgi:hypothetical protein
MQIERVINAFDKSSEELVYEINVDAIKLEALQDIFHPASDDLVMYLNYDINSEKAQALARYIDINFDFEKYDYQLACYSA